MSKWKESLGCPQASNVLISTSGPKQMDEGYCIACQNQCHLALSLFRQQTDISFVTNVANLGYFSIIKKAILLNTYYTYPEIA